MAIVKTGEVLVIDLFAGPGGLGEGVSSCKIKNGSRRFQMVLSVEKDLHAKKTHKTKTSTKKHKG